jgi:hypothetical protein
MAVITSSSAIPSNSASLKISIKALYMSEEGLRPITRRGRYLRLSWQSSLMFWRNEARNVLQQKQAALCRLPLLIPGIALIEHETFGNNLYEPIDIAWWVLVF